ncbi:MAG: chemotaxis protein CheD, partial [Thermodesulfobacteriota bacterium]
LMPENREVEVFRYLLQPGYIFTSSEPSLVTTVVGTCVAVCLYDRRRKMGGMNHFLYPKAGRREKTTPQFGNVAIPALIRMMVSQGCREEDMEAQLFGGGSGYLNDPHGVGRQNVKMARKILKKRGIPIVSEDVGGTKGRRLIYHTWTNEAIVMKTHRLRRGDWYPYRARLGT